MQKKSKNYFEFLSKAFCLKIGKVRRKWLTQKWRKELKVKDFSIICSSCIGGLIYHDLGLEFLSPTVNMHFSQSDFIKFACNLRHYCSLELDFIETDYNYPVALLDDITLHFNHAKTVEQANTEWIRRKSRIHYDNIYLIFFYREGYTIEDIRQIERAEYKQVIVLSHRPIDLEYSFCMKGNGRADQNYMEKDKFGIRTFEKEWDFVSWLNGDTK